MRRPELQLRVPAGAEAHQIGLPARHDIHRRHHLRVAAIEPFRQPQHGGERPDRPPQTALERPVPLVRLLRGRLTMIPRQQRNDFDLLGVEPA